MSARPGRSPPDRFKPRLLSLTLVLNAECDIDSAHRLLAGAILAYADHYDAGDAALAEALHSLLMLSWYEGRQQLWKPFNDAIARIVAATHTALQEELIPAQITASVYAGRLIDCREGLWQVIHDGWEALPSQRLLMRWYRAVPMTSSPGSGTLWPRLAPVSR